MSVQRSPSAFPRSLPTSLLVLMLLAPQLPAQTLEGRVVGHVLPEDVKVVEVGDVPGHTVILLQARGLAFLENGEVAEVSATETLDHTDGEGTYRGYEILRFEDGSTVVSEFEGEDRLSEDGRYTLFEGTFRYVGGTGRFEGIEGGGTHSGRNHLASGVGFYVDFEGTYSLAGGSDARRPTPAGPADAGAAAEIAERVSRYLDAIEANDVARAAGFWAEEARLLGPGMDLGREDVLQGMRAVADAGGRVDVLDRRTIEIFVHGDVAYEIARAEEVFGGAGEVADTVRNNLFVRWERGPDGEWRFDRVLLGPQAGAPE